MALMLTFSKEKKDDMNFLYLILALVAQSLFTFLLFTAYRKSPLSLPVRIVLKIIGVLLAIIAARLSWECNSSDKYPLWQKILFSILAYMFGIFYIIYFLLFRFNYCYQKAKKDQENYLN